VVFDPARVLADQVVRQLPDGSGDRSGPAFESGLAPAGNALVGVDLEK
jgi:hypothetical protein